MKTRKEWERSDRSLIEFLHVGDQIDEALFNYIGEVVAPQYCSHGFNQCGEPDRHEGTTSFHVTAAYIDGKYYYLGILPAFK